MDYGIAKRVRSLYNIDNSFKNKEHDNSNILGNTTQ